jgi:hypothetical protein
LRYGNLSNLRTTPCKSLGGDAIRNYFEQLEEPAIPRQCFDGGQGIPHCQERQMGELSFAKLKVAFLKY